jgi:hypothetical protein
MMAVVGVALETGRPRILMEEALEDCSLELMVF